MTFYLSNPDIHPVGLEPAEFLDLPLGAEAPSREPDRFGYLRVRIDDDEATAYVSAYMADGTQIRVRTDDVLPAPGPTESRGPRAV